MPEPHQPASIFMLRTIKIIHTIVWAFFASSILFVWRFRAFQKIPSRGNVLIFILSILLLITSHLFGILVVFTVLMDFLWKKLVKYRWLLFAGLLLALVESSNAPKKSGHSPYVLINVRCANGGNSPLNPAPIAISLATVF